MHWLHVKPNHLQTHVYILLQGLSLSIDALRRLHIKANHATLHALRLHN